MNKESQVTSKQVYKLTSEQNEVYVWLKNQSLNTDDDTLNYWVRKYPKRRIIEVVNFANSRRNGGQSIRNIGGWINKFLMTCIAVVNDECKINNEFLKKFIEINKWPELKIYEKYVKDEITGDDLPLTMAINDFRISLEALYKKSILYR
jgi:hypothetical protein